MKNELRIGNWVLIHRTEIQMLEGDFSFRDDFFSPIPLNDKWLLNFGFEVDDINWEYWKELDKFSLMYDARSCVVYINDGYGYEGASIPNTIKYVHQLQNLYFALTNEELTLKL